MIKYKRVFQSLGQFQKKQLVRAFSSGQESPMEPELSNNERVGTSEEWGMNVEDLDLFIKGNTFDYTSCRYGEMLNHSTCKMTNIYDGHTFSLKPTGQGWWYLCLSASLNANAYFYFLKTPFVMQSFGLSLIPTALFTYLNVKFNLAKNITVTELRLHKNNEQLYIQRMSGQIEEPMVKYARAIAVEQKRIKIGIPKGNKIVYMNVQMDVRYMEMIDKILLYAVLHPNVHKIV